MISRKLHTSFRLVPRSTILDDLERLLPNLHHNGVFRSAPRNRVHNGLQGHPRSLILTPIESAFATSYWASIVTLVLYLAPFQRYCRFSAENSDPTPIPPEFWDIPLGLDCWCCGSEERDSKLIIRVITFELAQHIRPRINVTDKTGGQTDRQTDGRLTIAIPR